MKIKVKKIDEKLAENYTKVKIGGFAEIRYGDNVIKCRNKWTRYFMSSIVLFIADGKCYYASCTNKSAAVCSIRGMSYGATARIGTDTHTATNPDMIELVSEVDVAPNKVTRRLIKEPDYSLYIAEFVFTWNAGTLPNIYEGATGEGDIDGRVGEIGVYLYSDNDDWTTGTLNPCRCDGGGYREFTPFNYASIRLCARISSGDGNFDPFEFWGSIDPLTFKWRFQVAIV